MKATFRLSCGTPPGPWLELTLISARWPIMTSCCTWALRSNGISASMEVSGSMMVGYGTGEYWMLNRGDELVCMSFDIYGSSGANPGPMHMIWSIPFALTMRLAHLPASRRSHQESLFTTHLILSRRGITMKAVQVTAVGHRQFLTPSRLTVTRVALQLKHHVDMEGIRNKKHTLSVKCSGL